MYNQHTKGMATTRHRSLVKRAEESFLFETKTLQTHQKGEWGKGKTIREKLIFKNLQT
jgi:hypothetical protein